MVVVDQVVRCTIQDGQHASPSTSGNGKYMDFTHSLGEQPNNITVLLSGSASGVNAWQAHDIILDGSNNQVFGYQVAEMSSSSMRIWMSAYGVQEHKGAAWSGDSSSNGATKHQWGSGNASYVRVIATLGAGGGGGSSGTDTSGNLYPRVLLHCSLTVEYCLLRNFMEQITTQDYMRATLMGDYANNF